MIDGIRKVKTLEEAQANLLLSTKMIASIFRNGVRKLPCQTN